MKILVTGHRGFIGKRFVDRCLIEDPDCEIIGVDKISYASDVGHKFFNDNVTEIKKDINDITDIPNDLDFIVHFAASSHVDRSVNGGGQEFVHDNVLGTRNLLDLVRQKERWDRPVFIHISTDEVMGDAENGFCCESDLLCPSNPYAATKAAAEHLVTAWGRTYGINYLIIRPSNNYGRGQYPEKLIPRTISRFKRNKKAIVVGTGGYKRTWTHVVDTSRAIKFLMNRYSVNDVYHVTSGFELSNLEVIKKIYDNMVPRMKDRFEDCLEFVENRKGQDIRYGCSGEKLLSLGFEYTKNFDEEIKDIIESIEPNWGVI